MVKAVGQNSIISYNSVQSPYPPAFWGNVNNSISGGGGNI